MERPGLAFIIVIVLAIGVIALTSRDHTVDRTMPERMEEQQQQEEMEARKKQAASAAKAGDPARLKAYEGLSAGAVKAELEIENVGTLKLELYPQAAPKTVAHIVDLAGKGFYAGIRFHRLEDNFVVQGGDPESKKLKKEDFAGKNSQEVATALNLGGGGSGTSVPLENKLPHLQYTLGLARSKAENSGDSQFFINIQDSAHLDKDYCAFGRVVEGQDLVTKIQMGDAIKSFKIIK